jgi:hypothetical protein
MTQETAINIIKQYRLFICNLYSKTWPSGHLYYENVTFLLTWARSSADFFWSKWVQRFLSVRLYGCRYVLNFSHFQLRLHAKSPILPQMFI